MKILWSPQAIQDLNRIVEIIRRDKPLAASLWAKAVYKKVSRLKKFPRSGRILPELGRPEIREILAGDYRIIYKLDSDVSILTVFHGAKKVKPLLKD